MSLDVNWIEQVWRTQKAPQQIFVERKNRSENSRENPENILDKLWCLCLCGTIEGKCHSMCQCLIVSEFNWITLPKTKLTDQAFRIWIFVCDVQLMAVGFDALTIVVSVRRYFHENRKYFVLIMSVHRFKLECIRFGVHLFDWRLTLMTMLLNGNRLLGEGFVLDFQLILSLAFCATASIAQFNDWTNHKYQVNWYLINIRTHRSGNDSWCMAR